ncbi:putative D-erythrulose 4-phosphate dehydrogenase EryC [Candidatus Paraburkholderia calva]|nr:putative D-erythrulose 4-phosphate dehydrogenase EryC [Candidatus Paraburkholderia calva]
MAGGGHAPSHARDARRDDAHRRAYHLRHDLVVWAAESLRPPDADVRRYYIDWFKTFADITADLGGESIGTQFAIFTYKDFGDAERRAALIRTAIDCWVEVAEHDRSAGLKYVFWEPMSIGREFGETIAACMALQDQLSAANMAIPMWMMADIDHGDVTSPNPDDFDPYAWARVVPKVSPIIHIKQSLMDKGGHRPFTGEYNALGRIQPEPLHAGGGRDNEICLELSFKEREPTDRQVVEQIAESVAFWAPRRAIASPCWSTRSAPRR